MLPLNKNIAKLKNLIGIVPDPTPEDLLFEIVQMLSNEMRLDGEFKLRDVSLKTKIRISGDILKDVEALVNLGYVNVVAKNTTYVVIRHLWE